jgi:hypothetical protein
LPQGINNTFLRSITKKLQSKNPEKLLRALKIALAEADVAGIETERLYSNTFVGTNDIVQDFVDEVYGALQRLNDSNLDEEIKAAFFHSAYDSYGRTSLCLSGGGALAFGHFGVVKALFDLDMLPKIISGSSAGTLAASICATRTDAELKVIFNAEFLKPHVNAMEGTWFTRILKLFNEGSLFDAESWRQKLSFFSNGDLTFSEAHARTGRILNICIVSKDGSRAKILNVLFFIN